ncbi:uncharacterized protein At1g65710-like [Gastrolobium bilobum]|uniref:uncharacterized protein At1g65710-like n=1 Tax=Gastrolobium bilobum TaxID=150636 RepID=UPI002AB1D114|nr:uncharacterized protein At1g65710-like [Gastrolobium bilobum]
MGTCLSKKKKGSSTSPPLDDTKSASTAPAVPELKNGVTVSKTKVETEPDVKLKKENKTVQQEKHESVQEEEDQVKKEIFIIKHRKSHDDRERNSKCPPQKNAPQPDSTFEAPELMVDKIAPPSANIGVGVRTSSCTKEEVDAILIQCGRLSRSSSDKAAFGEHGGRKRYSGSKRSYDFDHCENDTISTDEDQKKANTNSGLCEDDDGVAAAEKQHQHRQRHRQSPRSSSQERRRRTPSREREQHQRSSSRERRVSKSPGRRSSETTTPSNARNNSNTSSRPGKMVSVPATVSSLVMDKSNNGGGESAANTGIKRITVKRNVGVASPRSQSPARATANNKVLGENQQQHSLSRNSSRKAEQSPHRRIPLNEVEPNSLSFPQTTANNNSSKVQNKSKKEIETEANQKPNTSRTVLDKGVCVNYKTKVQPEEDVKDKVKSSMTDNIVVKTVVPPGVDNLKPQTLTRSRSARRSRDLDLNPEALLIPPHSYTSLLLEDIQNFHQKNTPSISLPACVTKACSILEAVADLNSNTSSNFCGAEDRRSPPAFQSSRNDYNVPLGANNCYGKRVPDTKDPIIETELVVIDDVMEPSLHKYVTVNRGGSLGEVDMEDLESSGSNSFTVSSGQQNWGISSSSWEPNSVDSKDCWTSRLNNPKEEGQKSQLGLEGMVSSEAGYDVDGGARKKLNNKGRVCDQNRGRLGANKVLHTIPVVTAAAST